MVTCIQAYKRCVCVCVVTGCFRVTLHIFVIVVFKNVFLTNP